MAVNTQFSIAVHIMASLAHLPGHEATSSGLASSVNTGASFVRRVLAKLSKAGLVVTATGQNGSTALARDPRSITLLDIYKAVDAPSVFSIHKYPENVTCQISCTIKSKLSDVLDRTQASAEATLGQMTLADVAVEE